LSGFGREGPDLGVRRGQYCCSLRITSQHQWKIVDLRLQPFFRQLAEELERFIELAHGRASNPAATIQLVQ
jgi:hypothetical protein